MILSLNNMKNLQKNHTKINKKVNLKLQSIQTLYSLADQAYHNKAKINKSTTSNRWNKIISQTGTKSDKILAISNLIMDYPQSCLEYIDTLLKWCFNQKQSFALASCQALVNIYIDKIFSQKSFLKNFQDLIQQYIHTHRKNTQAQINDLIGFYLQNKIKHYYGQLLKSIQLLLKSNIVYIKKNLINLLIKMTKYQQLRRTILSLLINKIGQNQKQIVNTITQALKKQLYQQINLTQILLQQIQSFLFRRNLSTRSQFYVVNFLNTINFKYLNQKSINRVFQIFYHFFNKISTNQQTNASYSSRLFLNSIKGINRIFALYKNSNKQCRMLIQSKIDAVYKLFHISQNIKAKVQLLLFLFQSHSYIHNSLPDRFYRVVYQFTNSDEILKCSLAQLFFDLIMITLKQDQNLNRNLAFIKRLLQLCFRGSSNFIITTLIMLNRVIEQKDSLKIAIKHKQKYFSTDQNNQQKQQYDMLKRQPLYSKAQTTCIWQLNLLLNHYHPTIRKYAHCIINNQPIITNDNNPLIQYSLSSFIQKINLKKQKKSQNWKLKVLKNLKKIRTSKYQSLLEKSNIDFKQDQQFIKNYLNKRIQIRKNIPKYKYPKDIQQYADQVIQKQIDKMNPNQFNSDDISNLQDQIISQNQQFSNQIQQDQINSNIQESQNIQQQDSNIIDQDQMEQQQQQNQQEQQDDQKQFEDVFNQIGQQQQQYPKKKDRKKIRNKQKKIQKPIKKKNNKKGRK